MGNAPQCQWRTVDWRFTTADARIKLKKLYPTLKAIRVARTEY